MVILAIGLAQELGCIYVYYVFTRIGRNIVFHWARIYYNAMVLIS